MSTGNGLGFKQMGLSEGSFGPHQRPLAEGHFDGSSWRNQKSETHPPLVQFKNCKWLLFGSKEPLLCVGCLSNTYLGKLLS